MLKMTKTVVVFFVFVMLCSFAVRAQSGLSRLGGTVIDATGAIVQGAKVIATNEATGVEVTQVTTSNGSFAFASLPAGHFVVGEVGSILACAFALKLSYFPLGKSGRTGGSISAESIRSLPKD